MINLTDGIEGSCIAENSYASVVLSSANFSSVDIVVSGRCIVANEDEIPAIQKSHMFPETCLMRERKSRISSMGRNVFIPSIEDMGRHGELLKSWLALLPNTPDVDEFGRPWELHKRSGSTPAQQRYFMIVKNRRVGDR